MSLFWRVFGINAGLLLVATLLLLFSPVEIDAPIKPFQAAIVVGGLIALVVAGQMAAAITLDHFGAFGLSPHPISVSRLLGAALLIAGVVLIKD